MLVHALSASFGEANCYDGKAHVVKNWGEPPAINQCLTEALGSTAKNTALSYVSEFILKQILSQLSFEIRT